LLVELQLGAKCVFSSEWILPVLQLDLLKLPE
jgi:hypothetical protein